MPERERWKELRDAHNALLSSGVSFKGDCVVGKLYRVQARNLDLGVYLGQGLFVGLREKLGALRLDVEGNARVIELLPDEVPEHKDTDELFPFFVAMDKKYFDRDPPEPESP